MYAMIDNKIIKIREKSGRTLTLIDGSTCDISQVRYIWKKRVPEPNPHYLNPHILREIFRQIYYEG